MSPLVNCLHTKVKYAPETLLMSINTHACVYRLKLSAEEKCDPQLTAIPGLHLWMTRTVWSTYEESSEVCLKRMRKLLNIHRQVITIISIRLLQHHSHSRGCGLDVSNHSRLLSSSVLSGERGLTCQFNIDLLQMFVHACSPKFTPLGPSMNSWNSTAVIPSRTSQMQ